MSGHSQWQMIIWRIDVVAFFFPTYIINYTVWQISPFKPLTYSSFYILWSPTLLKTWYLQAQASFHSFYWTWVRSLATLVSLVDFIDLTLACEDANLKLVEVVTVLMLIKYQIYCTQIKYIYLAATALHSWAAVQRHLSAKLLQVSNFRPTIILVAQRSM